ncbi:MAG: hypothetical protein DRJ40_11750 [Thermoprotei archaeon]|nr:MAG: hypothetical protein DRJ40_11750 [Thermoprotei archaeon]
MSLVEVIRRILSSTGKRRTPRFFLDVYPVHVLYFLVQTGLSRINKRTKERDIRLITRYVSQFFGIPREQARDLVLYLVRNYGVEEGNYIYLTVPRELVEYMMMVKRARPSIEEIAILRPKRVLETERRSMEGSEERGKREEVEVEAE